MTDLEAALRQALAEGRPYILITVDDDEVEILYGGNPHLNWRNVAKMLEYVAQVAKENADKEGL